MSNEQLAVMKMMLKKNKKNVKGDWCRVWMKSSEVRGGENTAKL